MNRKLVLVVIAALLALAGCGPEQGEIGEQRAELSGDSPLIGHFREAEAAHGVPAEVLATVAWLQTRLSTNNDATEQNDHGLREWGVMAIGTGGLTTLEQAAALVALTPDEVARDPRANILAAAALLADEARRQGLSPKRPSDWAPVLAAYGGDELAEAVPRLLRSGWNGWDDDNLDVEVKGVGEDEPESPGEGLGVVQQALGFPGAKWSPASSSNYTNANRGAGQINYVVIHTIQGSYAGAISWFKNPAAKVSAHYVVRSSDGAVTQMVDDRDIAWQDACFNTYSIGIEHEGYVEQPSKWYTDEMYRGSARLVSWLCDKYNIPKDRNHIMGHGETPDCSDHTDPGSGWNWSRYMKYVKTGGKVQTLKAKLTKRWSNAKRFRGKGASYIVCAGDPFKFSFSFKNSGSATWRDVPGRGDKMGSDVFLVTTSGKKDKLSGKVRFSVRRNKNHYVRGDRKAGNCSTKNGCRRTTFIKGGISATAPKKPGIYTTRWRLRDYSKFEGKKSKGFGPKVQLKFKVKDCTTGQCGCWIWCTDGSKKKIAAEGSSAQCKSVGATMCGDAKVLHVQFTPCETGIGGASGVGGTSSGGTSSSSGGTSSGSGGTSSSSGGTNSGAGGASSSSGGETGGGDPAVGGSGGDTSSEGDENDPNADTATDPPEDPNALPEEDDPGYDDDGFAGDEEAAERGETVPQAGGCSVSGGAGSARGSMSLVALLAAGVLALRRRRLARERRPIARRLVALACAAFGLVTLLLTGCSFDAQQDERVAISQQAVSAPKKAYCKVPVEGRGTKDMESDYLPHVITCENGGAGFQALKAQAIAARSVAYYSMATKGSICDSQGCQVYSCGASPSEAAKKAVRETSGMYLSYAGQLTYAFFVAGGSPSSTNCHDTSGYTSGYVTYNHGKTGKSVEQTSLGWIGPPGNGQNRGCMSQLGARCLESKKDYNFMQILRFYYGADIKVVQADGPCVEQKKTLRAKLTKKWSNAKRFRGKKANYIVCAGDPFELAFTFKNTGSATWRDVKGRGKKVGSDVFLVTANGKKDKLTGKSRFSLKLNKNRVVRGDHKSKNCSTKNGCRRTTFIKGGMNAKAPNKPGIYTTRWRLRDYSKAWGKKSHGFGPKVELKVRVKDCTTGQCGCYVWCTDGSKHKVAAEGSAEQCKDVGKTICDPANVLRTQFTPCEPTGGGGTAGTAGTSGAGGGTAGTSGGWSSSGGTSGGVGGASNGGTGADTGGGDPTTDPGTDPATDPADDTATDPETDPNAMTPEADDGTGEDEFVEDDADYTDDGFNGDEEGIDTGDEEAAASCAVTTSHGHSSGSSLALAALVAGAVIRRRWRGKRGRLR